MSNRKYSYIALFSPVILWGNVSIQSETGVYKLYLSAVAKTFEAGIYKGKLFIFLHFIVVFFWGGGYITKEGCSDMPCSFIYVCTDVKHNDYFLRSSKFEKLRRSFNCRRLRSIFYL